MLEIISFTFLGLLGLIGVIGVGAFFVVRTLRRRMNQFLGGEDIMDLMGSVVDKESSPKSISGIESLIKDTIMSDFEGFSLAEFKSKNIDEIYAYFDVLKNSDLSRYRDNPRIDDRVKQTIDTYSEKRAKISDIYIHKSAISKYDNNNKTAIIEVQTALQYMYSDKDKPTAEKMQKRMRCEWIYTLDDSNFNDTLTATLNCPNCGAPIGDNNELNCRYCHSELVVDYLRAWIISDIEMI